MTIYGAVYGPCQSLLFKATENIFQHQNLKKEKVANEIIFDERFSNFFMRKFFCRTFKCLRFVLRWRFLPLT